MTGHWRAAAVTFALATALVTAGGPSPAAGEASGRGWLALGDSYSSGEGIPGTADVDAARQHQGRDCRRATGEGTDATAWSLAAYRDVSADHGFDQYALVACTGALTSEIASQIGEAQQRFGRDGWDLVTVSVGGNDIGFEAVLKGCLDMDVSWGALFDPGCDVTEREMRERIEALRSTLGPVYDLVASKVNPGGDVIVAGYPNLVEEVGRWDRWRRNVLGNCEGIKSYDVGMLRSVTGYLNEQIGRAVLDADDRHRDAGIRFHFLDISRDPYEYSERPSDRHALCSPDPWLNGQTVGITSGDIRFQRSFHPHQVGHDNTGRVLATFVRDSIRADDTPIPPAEQVQQTAPNEWAIQFQHPSWGASLLVVQGPEPAPGPVAAIAYDAGGVERWRFEDEFMYEFVPTGWARYADPDAHSTLAVDGLGHIHLLYEPGRHYGAVVLAPVPGGFEDFGSLPDPDYLSGRWYSAWPRDVDGDGINEIEEIVNQCNPGCGNSTEYLRTVYTWDGHGYRAGETVNVGHAR